MPLREEDLARTILVAGDDAGFRLTVETLLRHEGFSVTAVADGSEALECLCAERFDLVLTDLRMPGLDGIGVLQEVKRRQPHAPVVLMTRHGDMDTYMAAMDQGAFDYLNKPLDAHELLALLRRALGLPLTPPAADASPPEASG